MTVVDFIDVIDDIIDLSSDEETVQQDHTVTQPWETLLDRLAVIVLADERRQDAHAAFLLAVEESQAATEFGNALVATASPSVAEKTPLHTAELQNIPSSPTATFPSFMVQSLYLYPDGLCITFSVCSCRVFCCCELV